MSDYIYLDNGLVIDENGEIIESADPDSALQLIVLRRHEAKRQVKEWQQQVDDLDRVILKRQESRTAVYGDTVATVRGGAYSKTNGFAFAAAIAEAFGDAFDFEHEDAVQAVLDVIAAATGFKRDALPEEAIPAYELATATLEKRPWVETSPIKRPAPARITGPGDAE